MATIQIRDVSEEAYETIRRRSRAAGQSIQAYMKKQVERLAREPDEDAHFGELERFAQSHGTELDIDVLLADLDNNRR
ncbi:MAG: antitoxin [bacterium]|nr:antitoxin [bacterium]MCY3890945.1 antitoxin [bacterium]MCY3961828.1 antitoxin [bacterium]MCY4136348.1 antitoxin [bacterium]